MKTLFIIYVILSVLVVSFCLMIFKALKKQIATISKLNADNVAEIKSRMEEINALTNALAKYKEADSKNTALLEDAEKALIDAKKRMEESNSNLDDTKYILDKYINLYQNLTNIASILLNRHGYNKLEGFKDANEVTQMLEFVKNNDTSKKRSRKKSEDKNKAE